MTRVEQGERVIDALEEDIRASWLPDPLNHVDLFPRVDSPEQPETELEFIDVPKPDGSTLHAPLLDLAQVLALHAAVEPMKDAVDALLAPGVCGYRRGAEVGYSYSQEHRRFVELAAAERESAAYVVVADVKRFFASTTWDVVLKAGVRAGCTAAVMARLEDFARGAQEAGLAHLPAGYADSRFLANLVLMRADQNLTAPFTRWVDDYRVFARSKAEAEMQVASLRDTLERTRLGLNERKVRIAEVAVWDAERASRLDSVYHPDTEPREHVRSSLRSIFLAAAPKPIENRRNLRFVLPRLGEQGDEVAVEWALKVLPTIPWEAPRLCDYLSRFARRPDVAAGVERRLLEGLDHEDVWMCVRLSALACRTGLSPHARNAVASSMSTTTSRALWSMLIRLLGIMGEGVAVTTQVDARVLNARAALAALKDVQVPPSQALIDAAPATHECLVQAPAPPPSLSTIL